MRPGRTWARGGLLRPSPGTRRTRPVRHLRVSSRRRPSGCAPLESRRVEAAVQRAAVLLVLPLGACFLPGFVATTVAPVVLHLVGGLAP